MKPTLSYCSSSLLIYSSRPPNAAARLVLISLQTRSFQFIDDLIRGMVAVMDGDEIGPFNVGNPGEFTMLELAEVRGGGGVVEGWGRGVPWF